MADQPKYRTIRVKEEDYQKLKEVQSYLRRKGTENIDWVELKKQNVVEVPEEDKDDGLNLSLILGLGAAALAYLIWKNAKK